MKRSGRWICAFLAAGLAIWVLYRYGASALTIMLALLLLSCPVLVVWVSLSESRRTRHDIEAAVRQANEDRAQAESGRRP